MTLCTIAQGSALFLVGAGRGRRNLLLDLLSFVERAFALIALRLRSVIRFGHMLNLQVKHVTRGVAFLKRGRANERASLEKQLLVSVRDTPSKTPPYN